MKKINSILVTDGDSKHALGIIRALGVEGFKIFTLSESKWALSSFSKFTHGSLLLPKLDLTSILDYIKKNNIDLVIPVGTEGQKFFSTNRGSFENMVSLFISKEEHINLAMDKQKTYVFAESTLR